MFHRFIDPKNDFAFKKLFGSEQHKDVLIAFLNDMVVFKEGLPIKNVTFLETIQDPKIAIQKTSILDILCEDSRGHRYVVEMQVAKEKGFEKRAQFYAANVYCNQSTRGAAYQDLKEVIFLAVCDCVLFPNKTAFKSDHIILDKESFEHDLKDFSFTFLELPKFQKKEDELHTIVDRWAYFFKHAEETSGLEIEELMANYPMIIKAYKVLNHIAKDEAELLFYQRLQMAEMDEKAKADYNYEEGVEEGVKQGIEMGIEVGIETGRGLARKEMIEQLLRSGMSQEEVVRLLG